MSAGPRLRFLRPFTVRVVNPITRLVAGHLPGFAIVIHVGRISGRTYRTPVNVFRSGPNFVVALTYGADVEWVKNVLASGGCELRTRGRLVRVVDPRTFVDPDRRQVPRVVRWLLGFLRVSEFLAVREATN